MKEKLESNGRIWNTGTFIDNLPLTDVNYDHSVALLKERFGQLYKLVNAHMDALTNLPKPVNNLGN